MQLPQTMEDTWSISQQQQQLWKFVSDAARTTPGILYQ